MLTAERIVTTNPVAIDGQYLLFQSRTPCGKLDRKHTQSRPDHFTMARILIRPTLEAYKREWKEHRRCLSEYHEVARFQPIE